MLRVRGEKGVWPCLLRHHRARVLLTGVEGFPHGGFRHFIGNINIRRVRPERHGGEKEGKLRRLGGRGKVVTLGVSETLGVLFPKGSPRNTRQTCMHTNRTGNVGVHVCKLT